MMNQNTLPKITVVTVTYNAQEYLETTIKSVMKQDYPNIEYIIIDGGSSDATVNIIKQHEDCIDYWVSEPDKGIYDAMNKAIDVATGEWINFMNAGDSFVSSDTISRVVEGIDLDDELIYGNINYIDDKKSQCMHPKDPSEVLSGMFCCHQTLFTKLDIMKQYRFDQTYKIAADYDFILKCYVKQHKFKALDLVIANFIAGGMSEKQVLLLRVEDMCIQAKYLQDVYEIYKLPSYQIVKTYEPDQNYFFSLLLNQVSRQLDEIKRTDQKIAVYGYGVFAKLIACELEENIVVFVDREATKMSNKKVVLPEKINQYEFDYILISVLGREEEISRDLQVIWEIPEKKIGTFDIQYSV